MACKKRYKAPAQTSVEQIVETNVLRLIGRYGKPLPLPRAPDEHTYANKSVSDQNFATITQTAKSAGAKLNEIT